MKKSGFTKEDDFQAHKDKDWKTVHDIWPNIKGVVGPPGKKGSIGLLGNTGPQGPEGDAGPQGATGLAGPTGPGGVTGPQGVIGESGPTGPTGPGGVTGPQGVIGESGPTGATGVEGTQGPAGDQGVTGVQGVQGATGVQGVQGIQGITGPQGVQGIQGITGAEGSEGPIGPTGVAGDQGIPGVSSDSIASDILKNSNDTERSTIALGYFKKKETKLTVDMGQIRIYFELKATFGSTAYGRIYKNGAAIGTARSTSSVSYVGWNQDLGPFAINDLIQIYMYTSDETVYVKNFRFKYNMFLPMTNQDP